MIILLHRLLLPLFFPLFHRLIHFSLSLLYSYIYIYSVCCCCFCAHTADAPSSCSTRKYHVHNIRQARHVELILLYFLGCYRRLTLAHLLLNRSWTAISINQYWLEFKIETDTLTQSNFHHQVNSREFRLVTRWDFCEVVSHLFLKSNERVVSRFQTHRLPTWPIDSLFSGRFHLYFFFYSSREGHILGQTIAADSKNEMGFPLSPGVHADDRLSSDGIPQAVESTSCG